MGKVYKLNIDKSLAYQVLEYAGWHKGKKVDIKIILVKYINERDIIYGLYLFFFFFLVNATKEEKNKIIR